MSALRIFSRFAELLDIKVTRAAAAWLRLNADGTVSERTAAETLGDIGGEASGAVAAHAALRNVHGLNISAGQTLTVTSGGTLGTAAYTASTAYATAAQGILAGTSVQLADLPGASVNYATTSGSATFATSSGEAGLLVYGSGSDVANIGVSGVTLGGATKSAWLSALGTGTPGSSTYLRGDGSWQTIASGLSGTVLTAAAGSIASTSPNTITQTWTGTVTYEALTVNITDSGPANAASTLLDLKIAGSSKFKVQKDGSVTTAGPITATTSVFLGVSTFGMTRPGNGILRLLANGASGDFSGGWNISGGYYSSLTTDSTSTITGAMVLAGGAGIAKNLYVGGIVSIARTDIAAGTTGAATINKAAGSVNLAAGATSLVVTNSLATAASRVLVTVNTNDATCKSCAALTAAGSITIYPDAAPTAETNVSFLLLL